MNDNDSNTPTTPEPDGSRPEQNAESHHAQDSAGRQVNESRPASDAQATGAASNDAEPASGESAPHNPALDAEGLPPRPDLPSTWSAPAQPYGQTMPHAQHSGHHQNGAAQANAFGMPQQHSYPQHQGNPAYVTAPGAAVPGAPGGHGANDGNAPASAKKKKPGARMLVAGLVIGALVGGASGAGTFAIIDSAQQGNEVTSSAPNSSVMINNNKEVTETTAIAAKASPSVVTISVRGSQAAGSGSGIILSKDGYVLTNNHVVTLDGEASHPDIQVTDAAGNLYSATIVGTDPIYDLAVIKLEDASDMKPMTFGDSSNINVGDTAVAIGAPLGLDGTVTDGIVSALNRSITVASSAVPEDPDNGSDKDAPFEFGLPDEREGSTNGGYVSLAVIQTDAAINPGNSGGALVDDEGELIGVNVAIASAGSGSESGSSSGSIGVGFAIPSNIAERIANEIIENGSATHGLLGAAVTSAASDPDATVSGALIKDITAGGAADEAGLRAGDVVTKYGDTPIGNDTDLVAQVKASAAGSDVVITYVRNGKTYTADVTLGKLSE
ncbi:S1C family serine protease [Paramicrobacterium agarici]|uniref:Putative serine protease PepD n=1 Tax=Paramicrobacterium agarici TaxID=630514 RepID=A0A2A9DYG4_9MICO|nr:trypsin-like peptidase domain-containing protein [Microbacterium agarici]PFG31634.1 putative serine protease PepD [Microbacterium agarici]